MQMEIEDTTKRSVCDAAFIAATQPHGVCGPGDWYKRWGTLSSTAALQPIVYIIICD